MDREKYVDEVERRLTRMFNASKDGFKAPPSERHRLEGFMQAGVFMGLVEKNELTSLMNRIHLEIFDKTIDARQAEAPKLWSAEGVDYTRYEQPTYDRGSG